MEKYVIELAKKNGKADALYNELVSEKIRERYSINAEIAILRQRDEKPEEFAEYNAYAEQCKAEVKAILSVE